MPRIAHVSDVHMLETRSGGSRSYGLDVRWLSLGRRLDARARAERLRRALDLARTGGADHVVVTGDLTESGRLEQFEHLAEVLLETGIDPQRMTLVPGNHDAYDAERTWAKAVAGPLRPFAEASAGAGHVGHAGRVVEVGGAVLLPVDATFHQPVTRSAGLFTPEAALAIERRAADARLRRKPMFVVLHHPPFERRLRAWQWIDGLVGHERLLDILRRFRGLGVLHGHMHSSTDRGIDGGPARVFGAPAVVEDGEAARVRFYDVADDVLRVAPAPALAA
jgi:3',5'-cyclic-AMP phosphodiesterase